VAPALAGLDGGEGPAALGMLLANVLVVWLAWCLLWNVGRRPRGARGRGAVTMAMILALLVFTSLPVPLGTGRPAWAAFTGNVVYYHGDVLGSSVLTTDQTGGVVQRAIYKPYGGLANAGSPPEFGFTGERFVAAAGIYDYGARWYDPTLGRFLQPDSLVPEPLDPQSLNRYSYVVNNPIGRIDPSGNVSFDAGLGFGTWSYSTGFGFDWDWGWALGGSFSTGSYGNGFGFAGMLGWDDGGLASDFSAWASSNYFGFGRSAGESYLASQFGNLGGDAALGRRGLQAEHGLGGQLGIYDEHRDGGALSRVFESESITSGDYAVFAERLERSIAVSPDLSSLGFGQIRGVMGHEYWHSIDASNGALQDSLYGLEAAHPEPITIWNSTFTRSDERGLANVSLELRATTYETRTSGYRGFGSALNSQHYLGQYGTPLEALGLRGEVLRLDPRIP
jgi:RHS repeat-associated protein